MAVIAGADGCSGGWLTIWNAEGGSFQAQIFLTPRQIFEAVKPDFLAVDVPIGLVDGGTRKCDREARSLLRGRSSCVFTPPSRANLGATSREEASLISKATCGKGVAAQHFGIYSYVREWDEFLQSNVEARPSCYEVHPELIFTHLNGGVPLVTKHGAYGLSQRKALLIEEGAYDPNLASRFSKVEADFLDATAAWWTSRRLSSGLALPVSSPIDYDATGLPMTMWV